MADKPVTREEKYLAYLTGDYTGELPKPITRKEKYLYELCLKGMGGEVSPEEIKAAVNEYLEKNPVKPGATTEQARQIEQNKTDIASLKVETASLKEDIGDVVGIKIRPNFRLFNDEYVDADGAFKEYKTWSRTDFIPVTMDSFKIVTDVGSSVYNCFYDADKVFISNFTWIKETIVKAPQNAKYFVISGATEWLNSMTISYIIPSVLENAEKIKKLENRNNIVGNCDYDAYLYRNVMPSYYLTEPENPETFSDIAYADSVLSRVPKGKHFIFVTDTHWEDNMKNGISLMQYVRKSLGGCKVIFGGDYINVQPNKYKAYQIATDFGFRFRSAFGGDFMPCLGNHDINITNVSDQEYSTHYLPYNKVYEAIFKDIANVNTMDINDKIKDYTTDSDTIEEIKDYFKMSYYVDDGTNKIRYLIVNSGNPKFGAANDVFGAYSMYEGLLALELINVAMESIPDGYDLVIVGHMLSGRTSSDNTPTRNSLDQALVSMAQALIQKATADVWIPTSISEKYNQWIGGSGHKYYDYSQVNNVGKILIFEGHYHIDFANIHLKDGTTIAWDGATTVNQNAEYEIPTICTLCDAYKSALNPQVESLKTTMVQNTTTDQAFDIVTINDDGVTCTRFGAGNDRIIHMN
nr:MAG TPA: Acid sphingomyelinase-like phosphodiesterase 3a [Caudoviricetes sp.]